MNLERWKFTEDGAAPKHGGGAPPYGMDVRHIKMIREVLKWTDVKRAVEIGCLNGRSTTAFVEAAEQGASLEWVGLCDMLISEPLLKVVSQFPKWVSHSLLEGPSDRIEWAADMWVIDGDHSEAVALADYQRARRSEAKVIVLHDTTHWAVTGPAAAARLACRDYPIIFEDCKKREGESTHRGILIAFHREYDFCMHQLHTLI